MAVVMLVGPYCPNGENKKDIRADRKRKTAILTERIKQLEKEHLRVAVLRPNMPSSRIVQYSNMDGLVRSLDVETIPIRLPETRLREVIWPRDIFSKIGGEIYVCPEKEHFFTQILDHYGVSVDYTVSPLGEGGMVIDTPVGPLISGHIADAIDDNINCHHVVRLPYSSTETDAKARQSLFLSGGHIDLHLSVVRTPHDDLVAYVSTYFKQQYPDQVRAIRRFLGARVHEVSAEDECDMHALNMMQLEDGRVFLPEGAPLTKQLLGLYLPDEQIVPLAYDRSFHMGTKGGLRCNQILFPAEVEEKLTSIDKFLAA